MTRAQGLATIHFEEPATSKKKYVCKICCKAFKRGEHCVRHERGRKHLSPGVLVTLVHYILTSELDTQEKPYNCGYCAKRYSRQSVFSSPFSPSSPSILFLLLSSFLLRIGG